MDQKLWSSEGWYGIPTLWRVYFFVLSLLLKDWTPRHKWGQE